MAEQQIIKGPPVIVTKFHRWAKERPGVVKGIEPWALQPRTRRQLSGTPSGIEIAYHTTTVAIDQLAYIETSQRI